MLYFFPGSADGTAIYNAYAAPDCSDTSFFNSKPSIVCGTSDNDDRMTNDDYVPPVVQAPPSISATPYPTGEPKQRAFIAYCPVMEPTRKPTFMPSVYPTRAVAENVTFSAVLVGNNSYLLTR